MKYTVVLSDKVRKFLKKADRTTALRIITWIEKNLEGCENPRSKGKGLTGDRCGEWRYRVGDYRILAEIRDNEILIYIIEIGHRKEIYN